MNTTMNKTDQKYTLGGVQKVNNFMSGGGSAVKASKQTKQAIRWRV